MLVQKMTNFKTLPKTLINPNSNTILWNGIAYLDLGEEPITK